MRKKKRQKPTEENYLEYTEAREQLLKNINDYLPPTPKEYERFFELHCKVVDWAIPRCKRCLKLLQTNTPDIPVIENIIDLDKCEKSRSKENCYVLLDQGFKARCGTVGYDQNNHFYTVESAGRQPITALPGIASGLCREHKDRFEKAQVLHFFLDEKLYPRKDKLYCDQCASIAHVERWNKKNSGKRQAIRDKYLNTLNELPQGSPHYKK